MHRYRAHDALPPRFAILTAHATRAHVFDAIRVRPDRERDRYNYDDQDELPTYAVRAHFPVQFINDHQFPAFLIEGPPYHSHGQHGTVKFLVEDPRYDIRFRTDWRCLGTSLYTMLDASPIPVLGIGRDHDMPCLEDNRLRVVEGDRRELHMWTQRWNPHLIMRLLHEHEEGRRARSPPPPPPRPATATPAPQVPVPKFVADTLIRDAVGKGATCPITMEPLAADTTAVTHCYHLFERNAIAAWLASNADHACAVCKTPTVLTL